MSPMPFNLYYVAKVDDAQLAYVSEFVISGGSGTILQSGSPVAVSRTDVHVKVTDTAMNPAALQPSLGGVSPVQVNAIED